MIVYVRHGNDEEKTPKYHHDNRMTSKGGKDVKRFIKFFIKKYGKPDLIICSPFRRAVDTLEVMMNYLQSTDNKHPDAKSPEIVIEPKLSRFFSASEKKDPSVHKATLVYGPPIMEKRKEFHHRTTKFFNNMIRKGYLKDGKLAMVITHALVLKDCAKEANVNLPEHYDFLEYFALVEGKDGGVEQVF